MSLTYVSCTKQNQTHKLFIHANTNTNYSLIRSHKYIVHNKILATQSVSQSANATAWHAR